MEKKLYKIDPIFEERIWGGQELRNRFHYESDLANIAEVYNVIAIPDHLDCMVPECGERLSEFYQTHHELFGCRSEEMPVRMILCAAEQPLSIQLHPDDEYAMEHNGMRGKPEGFVVVDCYDECKVVLGHYANTLDEFKKLAAKKEWDKLCRYVTLKKDEYTHCPSGTLHAFGPGAVVVAFSPNGDITYRLYDYDRVDASTGKPRELHVKDVLNNVIVPDADKMPFIPKASFQNGCEVSVYHDEPEFYTCGRIKTAEESRFSMKEFYFVTCVNGDGFLNDREIKLGETFFIPCDFGELRIRGNLDLTFISYKD